MADLAAALRARLAEPQQLPPARRRLTGVEHEYTVRSQEGTTVDFRRVIGTLDLDGRPLDPGDVNAVRGRWGGVITADGREAEVATPPVPHRPGFSDELAGWAAAGRSRLAVAAPDLLLHGYSTHLSVEVADEHAVRTARSFVARFALPQMLLLDRATSPGLLVRPRRRRLELAGEYADGDTLRAAAVFAAAATTALSERRHHRRLPPKVGAAVEPARGRYGTYVDRRAFGDGGGRVDLYTHGRGTPVGRGLTAQDVLHRAWDAVRPVAEATSAADEVTLVDGVVEGRTPLPSEADDVGPFSVSHRPPVDPPTGRVVDVRHRPGDLVVRAVVATWDGTALEVRRGESSFVVTVPLDALDGFLTALDHGRIDDVLHEGVRAAPSLPVLARAEQLRSLGAFGGIGVRSALALEERDPVTGRLRGAAGGGRSAREQKDRQETDPPRRLPRWVLAAAVIVALVALLATLASALGSDEDEQVVAGGRQVEPTSTTASPAAAAPVTADELPPEVWRGWVAAASDDSLGSAGDSRYYSRGWWVDGSSRSLDVVWRQDSHQLFAASSCQRSESAGTADGKGTSDVASTRSLLGEGPAFPDEPGFAFVGTLDDTTIFLDGITIFCDGTTQSGRSSGLGTFLTGFRMVAPADVDDVPETLSVRYTFAAFNGATEQRTYQVCMTRSTKDTDDDGLPDEVDLDSSRPGTLLELGLPGGPTDDVVIASRMEGGPAGVEGVPTCPTPATANIEGPPGRSGG